MTSLCGLEISYFCTIKISKVQENLKPPTIVEEFDFSDFLK
jgi:hypothetical protein